MPEMSEVQTVGGAVLWCGLAWRPVVSEDESAEEATGYWADAPDRPGARLHATHAEYDAALLPLDGHLALLSYYDEDGEPAEAPARLRFGAPCAATSNVRMSTFSPAWARVVPWLAVEGGNGEPDADASGRPLVEGGIYVAVVSEDGEGMIVSDGAFPSLEAAWYWCKVSGWPVPPETWGEQAEPRRVSDGAARRLELAVGSVASWVADNARELDDALRAWHATGRTDAAAEMRSELRELMDEWAAASGEALRSVGR
jgi:hypothetical protein